ncbi:MAG: hypothetical protein C0423_05725 [Methylibium sp.]|nr:hypothetical protein [Methylibium sp.]
MAANDHAYLNNLLENSPDGVFTHDMELKIRYVNPAFCRLLGFTREQLIGSSITDYLGDLSIMTVCRAAVEANGHCSDQETIFKRADGSMVHISKSVQAIFDAQNQICEILVTIRDMTELHSLNRRLEQTLAEREQANLALQQTLDTLRVAQTQLVQAEKMAALGSMVAGVAHELNTPIGNGLMAITSLNDKVEDFRADSASGLRRSVLDGFVSSVETCSQITIRNLQRAAELISSFKQVAADRTSAQRRRFYLRDVVDEVLITLGPTLKQSRCRTEIDIPAEIELDSYPGPLGQALTNLINNALIHGLEDRADGTIHISAAAPSVGRVVIVVSDDGRGIPHEQQGRIFDPFFTTRMGRGGTGLGLHVVHNVVTNVLGGTVTVKSAKDEGASFSLELPELAPAEACV